jgi:hypothetical protein
MDGLRHILAAQDAIITRQQALSVLTPGRLERLLGRQWRVIFPGVYAAQTGPLTAKQKARAALLYGGPDAQLDDLSSLTRHSVRYLPADDREFVLIPAEQKRQSREFVVVRRTFYLPKPLLAPGRMPITPLSRALADYALRHDDARQVRAVLMSAVQRQQVTVAELDSEVATASSRGLKRYVRVLEELRAGVRSVGEGDVRRLCARSKILPPPLFNPLLRLPDGRKISPDLLIEEAALVHETNGRQPHYEEEDAFDGMQERHDAMTTAGLTALHNSPRLIATAGPRILRELEAIYLRDRGRGLPPGVVILHRSAE